MTGSLDVRFQHLHEFVNIECYDFDICTPLFSPHARESGHLGRPPLGRREREDGNHLFGSYHEREVKKCGSRWSVLVFSPCYSDRAQVTLQ